MERFVVAAVMVAGAAAGVAQTGMVPAETMINPAAIAYSAAMGKVYAVDKAHNAVVVTDDATGKTSAVKVGGGPLSIAVNARTGKAYVTNAEDGTVSVIDGATDAVVATLKVGAHPYAIAVNPMANAKGEVYVSRTYSEEMMVIDGATDAVTGVKVGSPDVLAVHEKTGAVYLVGYESETVEVMAGRSRAVKKRMAGMHLWGLAVNQATGVAYATRTEDREVIALRPDGTKAAIGVGSLPCALAVNAQTNRVYAVNYADDSVTVIDGATEKAIATGGEAAGGDCGGCSKESRVCGEYAGWVGDGDRWREQYGGDDDGCGEESVCGGGEPHEWEGACGGSGWGGDYGVGVAVSVSCRTGPLRAGRPLRGV